MRIFRAGTVVLSAFALAVALSAVGCGGGDDKKGGDAGAGKGSDGKDGKKGGAGASKELKALEAKGKGTVKGRVTFAGGEPKHDEVLDKNNKDYESCKKGASQEEIVKPEWMVGPNKGLANVVVWLRAPKGSYFKLSDDQTKAAKTELSLDQPHCAFIPHVQVAYPSHFDGKKQVRTGQKFTVNNSANFPHNTNWSSRGGATVGDNKLLQPGQKLAVELNAADEEKTGEEQVTFKCNIHGWMTGYLWAFDHPFAAVTDKEGNYEIKNVPAGVEVELVHWHESFDKPKAETVTLKEGDNTKDYQLGK